MNGDWHLRYGSTDLPFGHHTNPLTFPSAPVVSTPQLTTSDGEIPRGDGRTFGTDYDRGTTIALAINALGRTEAEARTHHGALARAWDATEIRRTPAALAELVADSGRSAFGRPRRFASNDDEALFGMIQCAADFETFNARWYGDEQQHEVQLVSTSSGAFTFPMRFPLVLEGGGEQASAFTVGGELPTDHVVLEVYGGAILNPVVEVVGALRIETQVLVPFDLPLAIDARPWARTVLLGEGSAAGARTRASTRLSDVLLPPGTQHLRLSGQPIGNPRLRIRWRPAYPTY